MQIVSIVSICMKCQNQFSGKNKKNILVCCPLKILPRVQGVKFDIWDVRLIVWGLTTHQPLWVILCHLPEKGRDSRGDERERQGIKRKINESEETEEIKTFPLYP